jgi:hypothetical protein
MNFIKQIVVLVALAIYSGVSVLAQVKPKPLKTYLVWVKLKNSNTKLKGIFHEISDSSIFVSQTPLVSPNSDNQLNLTEYKYNNIDILLTRKTSSRRNGALIGGSLGFLGGAIPMYVITVEELGALSAFPAIQSGTVAGIMGLVFGGVAGSVKDRIPIKGSYENFNIYRNALQKYSFVDEYPASTDVFEHRWFGGFAYGPAFPLGDLGNKSVQNPLSKYAYTGGGGNIFIGYRFNRYLGFMIYEADNSNPLKSITTETKYWIIGKIGGGPIISYPVADNIYLDLKPCIGLADVFRVENDEIVHDGDGFGLNLKSSITYYYSKRWGIIAETGYFYTNQVFPDKSEEVFQTFDLNFGLVYRFGKRSL